MSDDAKNIEESLANLMALGRLYRKPKPEEDSEPTQPESPEDLQKRQADSFRDAATKPRFILLNGRNAAYYRATGKPLPPWMQFYAEAQSPIRTFRSVHSMPSNETCMLSGRVCLNCLELNHPEKLRRKSGATRTIRAIGVIRQEAAIVSYRPAFCS